MNLTSKLALLAVVIAIPTAVLAAPRSKNPQRATQAGRFAPATYETTQPGPAATAMDCTGCRTITVERRVGNQKASVRTERTECSGCETMAAGKRCF